MITYTGTELLTPGMPHTADEIQTIMRAQARKQLCSKSPIVMVYTKTGGSVP